jgi:outer membrane protein assembly factor BamB
MTRQLLGVPLALALVISLQAADWPQWRGPNRDGVSKETGLLREWPEGGPPLRWKRTDIGTGYSTPTVAGGRVYVQTTRETGKYQGEEYALALDERTGKDVWKTPIGKMAENKGPHYEGTRSSVTVDGDRLYCLASAGELTCLGTDGKVRWQKDLVKDFGGLVGNSPTAFNWSYSESVLVDGGAVVCTPGGPTATLLALDKMTGDVIWKCPVPGGDPADYASIVAVEAGGTRQYVQFLRKGVVGVDAKTGKFLWRYDRTAAGGASILTPVVMGNRVFTSSGMGGGGLVELAVEGNGVKATEVYFEKTLTPGIGGAVLTGGHLYGTGSQALMCIDFATGKVRWTERGVGPASLCYADGRLYVRGHGGEVALVEPSPEAYRERGRFKQPDRGPKPAWPHPVVANGGLYLRDWEALLCYDVRDPKAGR